jgi:hypothetical protein
MEERLAAEIIDAQQKNVRAFYQSTFQQQQESWTVLSQQYRFQFMPVATHDGISSGLNAHAK